MAPRLFSSFSIPTSPQAPHPHTPTVTQSPSWTFWRQAFDPKAWLFGTTSHGPSPTLSEATGSSTDSDYHLATILQRRFDEEDYRVFDCGVCLETLPEDSIAHIDPCGHSFCRDCVRGLIVSQIESRRFPVLCPTCTAKPAKKRPESIGSVTRNLVLEIGITQEQYDVWTKMEMAVFFVLLECRRCGQSSYLDKEGFHEARNLHCPMGGCNYVWCKECYQEFVPNGPKHSCDGSSELKRLVEQRGWKYCPACNTLCEKVSGCDHISCIAPGCRTEFCYSCGGWRTRSTTAILLGRRIKGSKCRC